MGEARVLIRITAWDENYENNRSRGLKNLEWLPVPNRMDGDGYTEIMDHANAAAHFGAWLALIQIASKCKQRGVLLRDQIDPEVPPEPHTPESLSRISRIPAAVFEEALPRFKKVGWISIKPIEPERVVSIRQLDAGLPHVDAALRARDSVPSIPSENSIPDEENPDWIVDQVSELLAAGGRPAPIPDQTFAKNSLVIHPPENRIRLLRYVQWAFDEGLWTTPAKTKSLKNLILEGCWDVEIKPRTLPEPRGQPEKEKPKSAAMRAAERMTQREQQHGET